MALQNKYVIRPHRPFRALLIVVVLIALVVAGQWFWHTHLSAHQAALVLEKTQLQAQLTALETRYQALSESQSSLQQAETMHQSKTTQLENRLQQLQQRAIDLNKELLFYQNITQGNSSSELQVRELQLRADSENPLLMRYRLVITQGENISEPITGTLTVSLIADSEAPGEMMLAAENGLNLRHVQVAEGTFEIAADTALPEQVSISLKQADKILTARTFDWNAVIAAGQ